MYEIPFHATTSADWSEAIELIDSVTNLPLEGIEDATFELDVRDSCGGQALTRTSADATITRPRDNIVSWTMPKTSMSGLCEQTYRVGLTMTLDGAVTQILIGSLAILDGEVR